ncbi:MAG TPA: exodeoxyribonuclease VII large subunit [Chthoniobacterales bacterium]|jgi:exodeoxyribonuclease VII large subunit|nr:exodeoxyribonuclease VII large subunit [Chthoniobacterales bacterium]
MQATADFFQQTSKVFTVAELTRQIRGTLETRFGAVWVQGEISNYRLQPSGHRYFTLKDQRAAISCVIFRNSLPPTAPPIADGAQVQLYGNVTVFEARGQYQLNVQILQTRGAGLLQAKFEALKRKLEAEGLFDLARKRALPKFPKRIGIITSPSGAAIRDMLNVLRRRAPNVQVLVSPVRVQGIGASAEIAVAIKELARPNESWEPIDLIVLARGGGSIEDLWEFNEEIVARAIFHSAIPIVSAIGHEIDFTIADFVADLRAPTPSAAAELIVTDTAELARRISELENCLQKYLRNFLQQGLTRLRFLSERTLARELIQRMRDARQQLDLNAEAVLRKLKQFVADARAALSTRAQSLKTHDPKRELAVCKTRVGDLERRLGMQAPRLMEKARQRFQTAEGILRVVSPEATLQRGYSITTDAAGKVIRSVAAAKPKSTIRTRVTDGEFESEVLPL